MAPVGAPSVCAATDTRARCTPAGPASSAQTKLPATTMPA